ncbi:unnamed protein product [Protopolystoma xenopodis]|uniref:Uncharacterized protein n=1 Tax=Protopolystoma xenopodis TaxID=117903 RepID=A0A3S5AM17_9PLAT|nr:unnamed protein product [Protopolystoma xenopodis]
MGWGMVTMARFAPYSDLYCPDNPCIRVYASASARLSSKRTLPDTARTDRRETIWVSRFGSRSPCGSSVVCINLLSRLTVGQHLCTQGTSMRIYERTEEATNIQRRKHGDEITVTWTYTRGDKDGMNLWLLVSFMAACQAVCSVCACAHTFLTRMRLCRSTSYQVTRVAVLKVGFFPTLVCEQRLKRQRTGVASTWGEANRCFGRPQNSEKPILLESFFAS